MAKQPCSIFISSKGRPLLHLVATVRPPSPALSNHKSTFCLCTRPHTFFFLTFHVNGIIQHVIFCVWLLSPSIMFLRLIRVVACIEFCSFLLLCNVSLYGYTTFYLSLHLLMNSLFWIQLLWTFAYKSWCRHMFSFHCERYLGLIDIARSYVHMLSLFVTF